MTPEQKQAAMQKLVDDIATRRDRLRTREGERSNIQAQLDRLKADCAAIQSEIAVHEEILKAIEAIEPGALAVPAQPPAPDPAAPPAPKKK